MMTKLALSINFLGWLVCLIGLFASVIFAHWSQAGIFFVLLVICFNTAAAIYQRRSL